MESSQLSDVVRRTDVISYALLAEINHFHTERAVDFRLAMQNYLKEQISFYQKVCKLFTVKQTCAFVKVRLSKFYDAQLWGHIPLSCTQERASVRSQCLHVCSQHKMSDACAFPVAVEVGKTVLK
jgi:hypothetical protein